MPLPALHLHSLFLEAHGAGPWSCHFCNEEVTIRNLCVHHDNENRDDHRPENLKPCHAGCHTGHHNSERVWTEEMRQRQAQVAKRVFTGRAQTEEHRRKIGEANRGKVRTQETRDKLSAAHKGKPWSAARRAAAQPYLDPDRPSDDQS